MLTSVHIENIALIKNTDISFGSGFNVLTGETGAGKSIIIDSLSLLCGARSDKSIIRSGEEFALVEGVFTDIGQEALKSLSLLDIFPDEDGLLILQRRISADGRSVAKINSRQVPTSKLKEAAALLIAIHGQQDTQTLSDEQKQLEMLDGFAHNAEILEKYRSEYKDYCDLFSRRDSLQKSEDEKNFRLDMINYRINEIEKARLSVGEEEKLLSERIILSNSEKIQSRSNEVYDSLYRSPNSALERVSQALQSLKALSGIIPEADELFARLENVKYEIEDISETISSYTEQESGSSLKRLDQVEERLGLINSLKRKYKNDVEGILKEYQSLKEQKETIESASEMLEKINFLIKDQQKKLAVTAGFLNNSRKKAALSLKNEVESTLGFLDMPSVKFGVEFIDKEFSRNGNADISFLISANAGEEPKPIAKIASGGELSRLMLALKSIPAHSDNPVMIFDEIDTGISGKTSEKIGIKLLDTSKSSNTQVICVTHSAQIAAKANTHLLISKSEFEGRTTTKVTELAGDTRVDEIARIIGGVKITDSVRIAAKEMINNIN